MTEPVLNGGRHTAVLEPPAMLTDLVPRVETARREWRRFLGLRAALLTAVVVLALGATLVVADWLWVLPVSSRLAAWCVALGAFAVFATRRRSVLRATVSRQDAAAEIESVFPELGQRLCTTLDYAEPTPETMPAWPSLVRALARDTHRRTAGINFEQVVPWQRLHWPVAALIGFVLLSLILLAISSELRTAVLRLFLLPVHYTQLAVEPGNERVKVGTDVTIRAILSGRPIPRVELLYRRADRDEDWTAVSFLPGEPADEGQPVMLTGTLETTLRDCQEDVEYRVVAKPLESDTFRLTVLYPLVLEKFAAGIEPPAYTRQKPSTIEQPVGESGEVADFQVIEGARVQMRFLFDRAPQTAELRLTPIVEDKSKPAAVETLPLQAVDGESRGIHQNSGGRDVPPLSRRGPNSGESGYDSGAAAISTTMGGELLSVVRELGAELRAQAADGMELEPKKFRLRVQLDRKPTIRFVRPDERIEVTPSTDVALEVASADDFGVARVGIVYQVGSGSKKTLRLDEPSAQPVSLTTLATLYLEEHPVTFRDAVSYYAFVEDNYPGGPHRVTTELRFIDIRPYQRAYQILKTGGT